MPPARPSNGLARLVLAACLVAFVVGCGAEKPVGDATKLHPDGITIDAESRKSLAKPQR